MSFEAVAAALHHSKASPPAKLVLVTIGYFEGDKGAWMSQETIGQMLGMSPRTVRRHIAELKELHEVDVIGDAGQGYGSRRTNKYFVILDCPEGCDRSLSHKSESAEVINLTDSRRSQYRSKLTAIEVKSDRNRGQI